MATIVRVASTPVKRSRLPFPTAWRPPPAAAAAAYALAILGTLFSPTLLLWLPSPVTYVYVIAGAAGLVRAGPELARAGTRTLALVTGACVVLGLHLFTAQGLHASAFLPELMALGRFSGDHYLHAAVAGMIRYAGVPSTGVDGAVPLLYHAASHRWFAAVGAVTGSDSARAYLVRWTVFMLPALLLALFVAIVCLRRSRPPDAPFLSAG